LTWVKDTLHVKSLNGRLLELSHDYIHTFVTCFIKSRQRSKVLAVKGPLESKTKQLR